MRFVFVHLFNKSVSCVDSSPSLSSSIDENVPNTFFGIPSDFTRKDEGGSSTFTSEVYDLTEIIDPLESVQEVVNNFDRGGFERLVILTSNKQLSNESNFPTHMKKLCDLIGHEKMHLVVVNVKHLLNPVNWEDTGALFCDFAVEMGKKAMDLESRYRNILSLSEMIPVFLVDKDDVLSFHFPDLLRILRGNELRKVDNRLQLTLRTQRSQQQYLKQLVLSQFKKLPKKLSTLGEQLLEFCVDPYDFIGFTKDEIRKFFGVSGMGLAKIAKIQKELRAARSATSEVVPVTLWDQYETMAYFEAKGSPLADVTLQIEAYECDADALLECDFQEILDETNHGADEDSIQNRICWNTFGRFTQMAKDYKSFLEAEWAIVEPAQPGLLSIPKQQTSAPPAFTAPVPTAKREEEVLSAEERDFTQELPSAVPPPQKEIYTVASTREIMGIVLELTEESRPFFNTAYQGVCFNQMENKYHVSFQDQKFWVTSKEGYKQPIHAAREMNMLCNANPQPNPDIGTFKAPCSLRLPTSNSTLDERVRNKFLVFLESLTNETSFHKWDFQIFIEMYFEGAFHGDLRQLVSIAFDQGKCEAISDLQQLRGFLTRLEILFRLEEYDINTGKLDECFRGHFLIDGKYCIPRLPATVCHALFNDLMAGMCKETAYTRFLEACPENLFLQERYALVDVGNRVVEDYGTAQRESYLTDQEEEELKSPGPHIFRGFYPELSWVQQSYLAKCIVKLAEFRHKTFHQAVDLRRQTFGRVTETIFPSHTIKGMLESHLCCILNDFRGLVRLFQKGKGDTMRWDETDELGNNLMHICALFGRQNIAVWILHHCPPHKKADWCALNKQGFSPLHLACIFGYAGIVEDLLIMDKSQAGMECSPVNLISPQSAPATNYKYDALYMSVFTKHKYYEVVAKFHKMLPDPKNFPCTVCGEQQWTALDLAVDRSDIPLIQQLLKSFDVNIMSPKDGKTAFARAAEKGDTDVIRSFYVRMEPRPHDKHGNPLWGLSSTGVHVNTQDHEGITPLMSVTKRDNSDLIRELIYFGADSSIRDKKKETADKYSSNTEVLSTLEVAQDPDYRNRAYFRVITRRGITLYKERQCKTAFKTAVEDGTLVKTSVVECLYTDGAIAHVKYYNFFGWIQIGPGESKNPLVRTDANLWSFERYLERKAKLTPKTKQTLEFWKSLREKYIRDYIPRGLPVPPAIPAEAALLSSISPEKSPLDSYILGEEQFMDLFYPEESAREKYLSRPRFKAEKSQFTQDAVLVQFSKLLSNFVITLTSFTMDYPESAEAKSTDEIEKIEKLVNKYINRDTIVIAWDIQSLLDVLGRQHDRCIDVNDLYRNYRQADVAFRKNTRQNLREPAALILSERLAENSPIEQYLKAVQKLTSLYLCTNNVEQERDRIRANEPPESDLLSVSGWRTKQDLIEAKCKAIKKKFAKIMNIHRQELLTGKNVVRIHVKKVEHLKNIEGALVNVKKELNVDIQRMSVAVSMKTKSQKKGFFVYTDLLSESDVKKVINYFQDSNRFESPFKAELAVAKSDKSQSTVSNKRATSSKMNKGKRIHSDLNAGAPSWNQNTNLKFPPAHHGGPPRGYPPIPPEPRHYNHRYDPHFPKPGPSNIPDVIYYAKQAKNNHEFRKAIQLYEDAIRRYPENRIACAEWKVEIAEIYMLDLGEMQNGVPTPFAQGWLDDALETDPNIKRSVNLLMTCVKKFGVPTFQHPRGFGPTKGEQKFTYTEDLNDEFYASALFSEDFTFQNGSMSSLYTTPPIVQPFEADLGARGGHPGLRNINIHRLGRDDRVIRPPFDSDVDKKRHQ